MLYLFILRIEVSTYIDTHTHVYISTYIPCIIKSKVDKDIRPKRADKSKAVFKREALLEEEMKILPPPP